MQKSEIRIVTLSVYMFCIERSCFPVMKYSLPDRCPRSMPENSPSRLVIQNGLLTLGMEATIIPMQLFCVANSKNEDGNVHDIFVRNIQIVFCMHNNAQFQRKISLILFLEDLGEYRMRNFFLGNPYFVPRGMRNENLMRNPGNGDTVSLILCINVSSSN